MPESDGYRFLIKSVREGVIEVAWSEQRDHHPVAVGTLHVAPNMPDDDPLTREAQAYIAQWQEMTGRTL